MGRRRGWFGRSGGWYQGVGDMFNNDFGTRWGWNQNKPKGVKKKGKTPKRKRSIPITPGATEAFCNDDISWLGNLVGASPMDVGANYTVEVRNDDDDDDLMMSMIDLTQDASSNDVMFGSIRGDIVGIQHYKGTVNNGEMVTLQREPHNAYDKNAIRVINMDSQQVGHIKRELAKPLAFILDNKLARVEGVVPSGNNNVFKMPIEITLWGDVEKKNEALSVLRSHSFNPRDNSSTASSSQASGSQPGLDYSHVISNRVFLSPSEVRNEMDKLFDTLEEGDKTTMAEPTQAIRTPLYPHQKQALNWMMCKENNEALPPFWEKRGQRYYNSLTVYTSSHRPSTVHGGILADDMGLGKTLEVISLILTNFHDGQPLAVPVAGRRRFGESSKSKTKAKKSAKKSQASTSKKTSTETNQSEWDIFDHCLANPENYIEDSDEEQERKAAKTLKIFQNNGPKFVMKPFGSSSESEDVKKSKSGLKNKSRCVIDNDDDDDDDDIIKGAKPRNKSRCVIDEDDDDDDDIIKGAKPRNKSRCVIDDDDDDDDIIKGAKPRNKAQCVIDNDDDDDSNSAQFIDLTSPSAKHNMVATDNGKIKTAADVLFDFLKSDSSSNSDDVDLNSNGLEVTSVDLEPKSNDPGVIHISDDSNESKKDNSELQLVEYTRYPSIIHDIDFLSSTGPKVCPVILENCNNSCDALPVIDQSNDCMSELQMAESREVTVIQSEDLKSEVQEDVIVIPDESPPVKTVNIKKGKKGWKVKKDVDYVPDDETPDIKKSHSLPPPNNSGRPKRNRKKPTRYVDINSDGSDTEIQPPAKRARHNSLPVKLEIEDIKTTTIPVQPIPNITPSISTDFSAKLASKVPGLVPSTPERLIPSTTQGLVTPSSASSYSANRPSSCQQPSSSSKCEANITNTSKISNTATKPKGKKGKGKGKKQKLKEEFGVGAPALPSLPTDINDENDPPSLKDDDGVTDGSDASSDEDWLPDLAMEIPFNCNKAAIGNCNSLTGRTKSDKPRTTLIVCPLSVMNNWLSQLEEHVRDDVELEIYTYYGYNRTHDSKLLENQDIVISTYNTIAADFKGKNNPLRKVHWLRIILDEGHYIRNSNTLMAKAITELKAERRWVLTGTPIQNSIKDLYSLVNFLNISPLKETSWWKRTIERPIAQGHESAIKRVRALMANIGMRRTKNQQVNGKPLVELPARNVYIEKIQFTDEERQVYAAMQTEGKLIISRYFQQGTLLHHYSQVLVILLRLRQLCCHPLLCSKAAIGVQQAMELLGLNIDGDNQPQDGSTNVIDDETKKKLIDALLAVLNSGSDEECPVCLESLKKPVITPCAHVYCRVCIEDVITKTNNNTMMAPCPMCRGEIKSDKLIEIPEEKLQEPETPIVTDENWQSSCKVDALMKSLVEQRIDDPTVKSIIVSQFTSLLTLIEVPLKLNGFKFARLDGTMTNKKRVDNIEEFMDPSPDSPTIFLLSLKAGGVGLNLTAASRVFLMDPAWNPAAEEQCFDRCHRLGQKRDVNITKFLVEDSVEERMLALQERKRALMNGAFSKKQTADERRTDRINEIRTLLDL